MNELWCNLFHKCLNMELHDWNELIEMLAQATDISIHENVDRWIRSCAEYNILFVELFKRNSQFYP